MCQAAAPLGLRSLKVLGPLLPSQGAGLLTEPSFGLPTLPQGWPSAGAGRKWQSLELCSGKRSLILLQTTVPSGAPIPTSQKAALLSVRVLWATGNQIQFNWLQ